MTVLEFQRRQHGLTQVKLATILGINSTLITQVEKKHRKPWPKFRREICKQLGMAEQELFEDSGWPIDAS